MAETVAKAVVGHARAARAVDAAEAAVATATEARVAGAATAAAEAEAGDEAGAMGANQREATAGATSPLQHHTQPRKERGHARRPAHA